MLLNAITNALHTPAPVNRQYVCLKVNPATLIGDPGWLEKPNLPEVGEIVDGESFLGEPRRGIYMDANKAFWFVRDNTFAGCIARWRHVEGQMVVGCRFNG